MQNRQISVFLFLNAGERANSASKRGAGGSAEANPGDAERKNNNKRDFLLQVPLVNAGFCTKNYFPFSLRLFAGFVLIFFLALEELRREKNSSWG